MPRMMLEEDEDLQTGNDTEITLGMKSLLGIFFGLVLICGVFFGFGFSMGRGHDSSGSGTPAAETIKTPAKTTTAAPEPAPTVVEENAAEDSSSKNESTAAAPALATAAPAMRKPSADIVAAAPAPQPVLQTAPPAPAPRAVPAVATLTPAHNTAATVTPAAAQAPVMVQIAAVSRQQDADILVAALRRKGYTASVRTESGNNFLHVQLGPFASRDEAKAMRGRLQEDGYNAFLK